MQLTFGCGYRERLHFWFASSAFLRRAPCCQETVGDVQVLVQGVPHLFSLVLQDDELQDRLVVGISLPQETAKGGLLKHHAPGQMHSKHAQTVD